MDYKLLIVDDEEHILQGMKHTLDWRALGFSRVETAQTYSEIIDKAIDMEPDIGLFDVCIGNHRGYDIITKLQSIGLKTKFIMMSGYVDFEYARKSVMVGAKDYLMKPVDRHELKRVVEKVIVEDLGGTIEGDLTESSNIDPVLGLEYETLSKLMNKILLMVRSKYSNNINLKSVAEQYKMNSTYLGQVFIKEVNMKFSEYLMVYRMIKAKEFIITSDEKISYIAHKVGYSSLNYFYSHFSSFYNQSPSDFREEDNQEES